MSRDRARAKARIRARVPLLFVFSSSLFFAAPASAQTLTADVKSALERLASRDSVEAAGADIVLADAGPAAVEPLIEALSAKNARLVARAASLLGRIGDRRAVMPLKRALRDARGEDERLALSVALCRLGEKEGVPPLVELLSSSDREMRLEASIALARYTHQDFGFRFDAPGSERAPAVERWRRWWRENGAAFQVVQSPAAER